MIDIKTKILKFITNCVDFDFWRFLFIVTFTTIFNKLLKLELPHEFRSICTSIFVKTNQRTEMDSFDIKDEDFEVYYKLRWLFFLAISDDCHIHPNLKKKILFKLELPYEFWSICTCIFATTNERTELQFWHQKQRFRSLLQTASTLLFGDFWSL